MNNSVKRHLITLVIYKYQVGGESFLFFSYTYMKNKYRNELNANLDLILYLATFEPDFKSAPLPRKDTLKQAQVSY